MIISDPRANRRAATALAEYPVATARAATALKTDPPGHLLEGEGLRRFLAEEERAATIVRQIKEILRTTGQPWNA